MVRVTAAWISLDLSELPPWRPVLLTSSWENRGGIQDGRKGLTELASLECDKMAINRPWKARVW